ncbi:MAG: hypothetical protein ACD_9C00073G0010 [uncultured bacterium]|nr:MAG: hypothetical protein ACD_9C00073G0010 [uncultured bacterium]
MIRALLVVFVLGISTVANASVDSLTAIEQSLATQSPAVRELEELVKYNSLEHENKDLMIRLFSLDLNFLNSEITEDDLLRKLVEETSE